MVIFALMAMAWAWTYGPLGRIRMLMVPQQAEDPATWRDGVSWSETTKADGFMLAKD